MCVAPNVGRVGVTEFSPKNELIKTILRLRIRIIWSELESVWHRRNFSSTRNFSPSHFLFNSFFHCSLAVPVDFVCGCHEQWETVGWFLSFSGDARNVPTAINVVKCPQKPCITSQRNQFSSIYFHIHGQWNTNAWCDSVCTETMPGEHEWNCMKIYLTA